MPKAFQQLAPNRDAHPGLETKISCLTPKGVIDCAGLAAMPVGVDGLFVVSVPELFAAIDCIRIHLGRFDVSPLILVFD